jgi:acetolactate synthase I/II/III large subunit
MWTAQFYPCRRPRQLLTSAGLGSMGFGLPAALGAKVAHPDQQVIDIDGDGSFLMNLQELATAKVENIAVKAVILNNQHLGMVYQWENHVYGGSHAHTYLGDPAAPSQPYPDFVTLVRGFGIECERVMRRTELAPALERMLACTGPYVVEIVTPQWSEVRPFIKAGGSVEDMMI